MNCYTFLQPFSGIHGINFKTQIPEDEIKINKKKYLILKKTENIIDISYSIDNEKKLSYVDNVNYSPPANKSIAQFIYQIIEKDIQNTN